MKLLLQRKSWLHEIFKLFLLFTFEILSQVALNFSVYMRKPPSNEFFIFVFRFVHVSQSTYQYLNNDYTTLPGEGHERSDFLKFNNITTYLIDANAPRKVEIIDELRVSVLSPIFLGRNNRVCKVTRKSISLFPGFMDW